MELMSDSEKEIMRLIWDHGGTMTISELLDQIEQTDHDWKRTTVRTFISRLIDKGMPVSYTHLDVYKRQGRKKPVIRLRKTK